MSLSHLFTSHWRSPLLRDAEATFVGISRGVPRRRLPFRYKVLRSLAPSRKAFDLNDPNEFAGEYRAQLETLGPNRIADDLRRVSGGRPAVLLCWEDLDKPGQWCHRRFLAEWLRDRLGVEVLELRTGDLPRREDVAQPSIFE